MSDKLTISKKRPSLESMDYTLLREKGLEHIESLGSSLWTDYNVHDPGVTILEVLCYAITDLGYRTSFDIKELLAEKNDAATKHFFTAREVLTCNAVTENDIRKCIIDVVDVKNAWVTKVTQSTPVQSAVRFYSNCKQSSLDYTAGPLEEDKLPLHIQGLYTIRLELDDDVDLTDKEIVGNIKKAVRNKLQTIRPLCEDFDSIEVIPTEDVVLCADIEVAGDAVVEDVLAQVYFQVHTFISPPINFYSLEEMLEKGKRVEEIFDGPFLDHGFIDTDELVATKLKNTIRVSDLYQLVMAVPGVISIKKLLLFNINSKGVISTTGEEWELTLEDLDAKPRFNATQSTVTFHRGPLPFNADREKALEKYDLLKELAKKPSVPIIENDLSIPKDSYRALEEYTTIQSEFPQTYGIGSFGLPESSTELRKAQAKQLKGYLLFYDQLLANYLSQLSHAKDLLSVSNKEDNTYFIQSLYSFPEMENLISVDTKKGFGTLEERHTRDIQTLFEDDTTKWDRRNRFLNHLIARFGEQFTEYALLMYSLYGTKADDELVADKERFLADYPVVSRDRGKAYQINAQTIADEPNVWDTDNISGLEARVARLLGINDYTRRFLYCESRFIVESYEVADGEDAGKFKIQVKNEDDEALLESTHAYVQQSAADNAIPQLKLLLRNEYRYEEIELEEPGRFRLYLKNKNGQKRAVSTEIFESSVEAAQFKAELLELACPEDCCESESCLHEGFHLVEHLLLRPRNTDYTLFPVQIQCNDCVEAVDPYSFRVSIIIPCWPKRFEKWEFRQYVEETIHREAPAHIAIKICWVSCLQMRQFEEAYKPWLEEMAKDEPDQVLLKDLANNVTDLLFSLKNVHHKARLHDCKTSDDGLILGHTNLGQI